MLEEDEKPNDLLSTRVVKTFFKSCVNDKKLQQLGLKPLTSLVKKYGGWPVAEGKNWNETAYNWIDTNARLTFIGIAGSILEISFMLDLKNSSRYTILVSTVNCLT